MADSIALSHPDFIAEDRWKRRAENLAQRLEDELSLDETKRNRERFGTVGFRAAWLRLWLRWNEVRPYFPTEVDHGLPIALTLLILSGYLAHVDSANWPYLLIPLTLINLYGMGRMARNAELTHHRLIELDKALKDKLTPHQGIQGESLGSHQPATA